jgi:hypothetical protein
MITHINHGYQDDAFFG